jgi:hypothetical protein
MSLRLAGVPASAHAPDAHVRIVWGACMKSMEDYSLTPCEEEETLEWCGAGAPKFDLNTMDCWHVRGIGTRPVARPFLRSTPALCSVMLTSHSLHRCTAPWRGCPRAVVLYSLCERCGHHASSSAA